MDLADPARDLLPAHHPRKEMEAQVPAQDPDEDADNVDDFDDDAEDQALSVLEDELNSGVEEEMRATLDDLADDQLAETLALAWVGAAPSTSASGRMPAPRRTTSIRNPRSTS
jgi:Mg/Co/Ni transporter MgtE